MASRYLIEIVDTDLGKESAIATNDLKLLLQPSNSVTRTGRKNGPSVVEAWVMEFYQTINAIKATDVSTNDSEAKHG